MDLYRSHSSNPKWNAQRNLSGRTHYVDDETLSFHKSRVISARETDGGLLFAIVTSDAQNYENTKRGFRYVIFDLFGTVVQRYPDKIEMEWFKTSAAATKAMWNALNQLDAVQITRLAIARAERLHSDEMRRLHAEIMTLVDASKVNAA